MDQAVRLAPSPPPNQVEAVAEVMRGRRTVVLAGAGCSTESGIPDYRGADGRKRKRPPVQYGDFVRSDEARRRYWARSTIGWGRMHRAEPNAAHRALASLETAGLVNGIITQNVDGLHHAAGSRRVVELHGALAGVICLDCGAHETRRDVQNRLSAMNAQWLSMHSGLSTPAPDGDADVQDDAYGDFRVPSCSVCQGVIKPDVVFFGETVPKDRVGASWEMVDEADALLVVGSSLAVFSGRRFVYGAVERGMPVLVANLGPTRADELAVAKVEGRLGESVPLLAQVLGATE